MLDSGIPGCGGLLTAPAGEFTSPQHPQTYEHNLDCQWVVRVPRGDRVKITFLVLDIESHENCVWVHSRWNDSVDCFYRKPGMSPNLGLASCSVSIRNYTVLNSIENFSSKMRTWIKHSTIKLKLEQADRKPTGLFYQQESSPLWRTKLATNWTTRRLVGTSRA